MKAINKLGKIITKIFEVFHWIGAVGMAIAAIGIIFANNSVENFRSLVAENITRVEFSDFLKIRCRLRNIIATTAISNAAPIQKITKAATFNSSFVTGAPI